MSRGRIKVPEIFNGAPNIESSCGASTVRALTALNPPEYETYKLTATYYTLNDNVTATLMLNNKGPAPILANPTFYSLAGTRLPLAPIAVPAASYIEIDMRQLLANAGDEFREGSVNIAYQGGDKQLGAQVRLIDSLHQLIWAEQMVYTSKFVSSRLENVWWLPSQDTRTRLVISNTSSVILTATLSVDGTSPAQSDPTQITLNPWETRVLDIMRDLVGDPNGNLLVKGGISISHSGTPGSLLARMFIAKPSHGYSASLSFVDPSGSASSKWNGNGLRLRNLDGTALNSVLVARNTSNQTARVRGRILYTNPNSEIGTVLIPATQIAAHSTKTVNLGTLITNAGVPSTVKYAGVELEYDTAPGTVITSVLSVSPDGNNVFQVPMSDPQKLPSSAGGFPWKADGDFRTLVYIKNETDSARRFIAYLTYNGGQYATGIKELRAGETTAIDFRDLRDNQTPDATDRLIPLDVDRGQIAWSVVGVEDKVLSGRSEQISLSQGIASTYACHNGCPNSYYDGWVDPIQVETEVGTETQLIAVEQDVNGYGQPLAPYMVSANWDSTDWTVGSIDSFGMADALDVGSTTFRATWEAPSWWYEITGLCTYDPVSVLKEAPMTVQTCAYPTNFHQVGSGTDTGGGVLHFDYAWTSSTGNLAHLSNCVIGEIVSYSGGNPFHPPSPPFPSAGINNPTIIDLAATSGSFVDNHSPGGSFVTPYSSSSYTGTQYYRFKCPCYNSGNYVNVQGPTDIVRTVSPAGFRWKYTITKSGSSATINPLP
jgi:hypothetical protein